MNFVRRDTADSPVERLEAMFRAHRYVMVLSGAGCSTAAGIPAYRDEAGHWANPAPVQLRDFLASADSRRRYWARSYRGWPRFAAAAPTGAHRAIAALEAAGVLSGTVTQNVDGLHSAAGSTSVVDLHGRLDTVVCLDCGIRRPRADIQRLLEAANPGWSAAPGRPRPDGDVEVAAAAIDRFVFPDCPACSGVLKPDVVFFGENVPRPRLGEALAALEAADALLVVGSSLMVWSGYRFVRRAIADGKPVAVLNRGRTRADGDPIVKLDADCSATLQALVAALAGAPAGPGNRPRADGST